MENSTTKLAIDLSEGTVQVEGNEEFVRFIYQDFKASLSKRVAILEVPAPPLEKVQAPALTIDQAKTRTKHPSRRSANSKGSGERKSVAVFKPEFNSALDLKDLDVAYDTFNPGNHNEKILAFAVFLRDRLQIAPCTANDVYTCYRTMKDKTETPQAFVQAFRTAENRTHYIEFVSPNEIRICIAGDNYYNKKLQPRKENHK